jgi:hypothetical protein
VFVSVPKSGGSVSSSIRLPLPIRDASVVPTIACGNTYLGCVMVAERIARKVKVGKGGS